MRLNELLNTHKKKGQNKKIDSRFVWATSNFMLMFLEPSILKYTSTPVFSEDNPEVPSNYHPPLEQFTPILLPWQQFKTQLFEIYDHRIKHA